jgi:hypothetical protein
MYKNFRTALLIQIETDTLEVYNVDGGESLNMMRKDLETDLRKKTISLIYNVPSDILDSLKYHDIDLGSITGFIIPSFNTDSIGGISSVAKMYREKYEKFKPTIIGRKDVVEKTLDLLEKTNTDTKRPNFFFNVNYLKHNVCHNIGTKDTFLGVMGLKNTMRPTDDGFDDIPRTDIFIEVGEGYDKKTLMLLDKAEFYDDENLIAGMDLIITMMSDNDNMESIKNKFGMIMMENDMSKINIINYRNDEMIDNHLSVSDDNLLSTPNVMLMGEQYSI